MQQIFAGFSPGLKQTKRPGTYMLQWDVLFQLTPAACGAAATLQSHSKQKGHTVSFSLPSTGSKPMSGCLVLFALLYLSPISWDWVTRTTKKGGRKVHVCSSAGVTSRHAPTTRESQAASTQRKVGLEFQPYSVGKPTFCTNPCLPSTLVMHREGCMQLQVAAIQRCVVTETNLRHSITVGIAVVKHDKC